ncbi:MAG: octaprenyl diphosphate synthase [Syntrophobacteraceae bacterium CG2_30_61_12]|nr:MAG: octaprenyl diphosphate synthase [Syntrophobacteraceae bacterium CG2_30_61_12]PIU32438.1 MAG: octaprenyl diphosphate synthase [Syntrophobacteraceae bacterium CG07_land_8_20_14_0_80_61_8]
MDPVYSASGLKAVITARIRPDLERIEAEIQQHLDSSVPLIGVVGSHIIRSGGKRLRPLLMILSARMCGYQGRGDAALAVVFEFLHAASLLHDDVVDNAEVRRKQPAANTIWGNPAAVLVGDFLYSKSILMTVGHGNPRILEVLTDTTTKMAEGEVLQLIHADDLELDEAAYLEVIIRKTAVLISAACRIGAIFGGADSSREQALYRYGHHLGIAFQLIDDLLDYTGSATELGKPVGNDLQEGKATLPLIYAMANADEADRVRLRTRFSADRIDEQDFRTVRQIVELRGGLDYTRRQAVHHLTEAKAALSVFPDQPSKETLQMIADYVLHRRV